MSAFGRTELRKPRHDQKEVSSTDLFFSRTDERGVIQAGNPTFQRISGFDWDELIAAPHKVIRHPDMPKAVYWLMWDQIKKGESIGAYVKNRTKDGKFYWTYSVVSPTDDGYFAARVLPESEMVSTIGDIYAKLLEKEASGARTPEESAGDLAAALQEIGFNSYHHFMAVAAAEELRSLDRNLDQLPSRRVESFSKMVDACVKVEGLCGKIFEAHIAFSTCPVNLQVKSARLGDAGVALATIARNLAGLAASINETMDDFRSQANKVLDLAYESMFFASAHAIRSRLITHMEAEDFEESGIDSEKETEVIKSQVRAYDENIRQSTRQIERDVESFQSYCKDVQRGLSGLSMTRVMCQTEAAQLSSGSDEFVSVIERLSDFQDVTHTNLTSINKAIGDVRSILQTFEGSRADNLRKSA